MNRPTPPTEEEILKDPQYAEIKDGVDFRLNEVESGKERRIQFENTTWIVWCNVKPDENLITWKCKGRLVTFGRKSESCSPPCTFGSLNQVADFIAQSIISRNLYVERVHSFEDKEKRFLDRYGLRLCRFPVRGLLDVAGERVNCECPADYLEALLTKLVIPGDLKLPAPSRIRKDIELLRSGKPIQV